jgi:hypothetical protein
MIEDLRLAYDAYQNAITNLQNPKVSSVDPCISTRLLEY